MNTRWVYVSLRSVSITTALALAGCSFAPSTKPPVMPSPDRYTATSMPAVSEQAGGVAQQFEHGAKAVPAWWRQYRSAALNAWVDEGLANNPSLDAARHTLEALHQQFRAQVGQSALPALDLQAQKQRQSGIGVNGFDLPSSVFAVKTAQLNLSYTFDVFGATRNSIQSSAAHVDLQAFELDAARRALAANIVTVAIQLSSLADQVASRERLLHAVSGQLDTVRKAHDLGAASRDDVQVAEQATASEAAQLALTRTQAERARHALAVLMGRTPEQAPQALPMSAWQLPSSVPVSVPSDLLEQRPDIQAAQAAIRAAAAQVGVATANLFPRLSLSASYGSVSFDQPSILQGGGGAWSAAAAITQPIFHGGALRAQRKAAIENYDASLAQYRQTVLNAFQNVADTLVALQHDAEAVQATQAAADAADASADQAVSRYRLGALSYPATLQSAQRREEARLDAIQSTASRLIDTAALFQAMGDPLLTDGKARSSAP